MIVFTNLGRLLLLFGFCFYLIGFLHASAIMYMVSIFCLVVLGGSLFFAWRALQGLTCERDMPATTAYSGDPVEGHIRLTETAGRWRLLEMFDQHVNVITSQATRRHMAVMLEGRHSNLATIAGSRQSIRTTGRSSRTLEVRDVLRFAQRGHYRLGPLVVRSCDPFGLLYLTRTFPAEQHVIVYPRPLPIPEMVLGGAGGRRNVEIRPIGHAGERAEFHSIRPYVQGDDLRRVHWKATAHTGRLAVKEFEYRSSGAVQVILDLQRGVHLGEKEYSTLETAITLTASVLNHVLHAGNQVSLLATSAELVSLPQESGDRQLHRALEALALARDDGAIPLAQALASHEGQSTRHGTAIIITPTVDQAIIGPLLALRGRSAQVLLVLLNPYSFYAADQEQHRSTHSLLAFMTAPIDLAKPFRPPGDALAPRDEEHTNLLHAAAAADVEVFPIGAYIPLHQALQGIRMRI